MRPIEIPPSIQRFNKVADVLKPEIDSIADNFKKLNADLPDISIIIPAYNEEENILKTLYSLSTTVTKKSVEVIVVNNNSTDRTDVLATAAGALCITEPKQGITNARNAGLRIAKGTYIINADADTVYPAGWIDGMVDPLVADERIALTYGRFSFIPLEGTSRSLYFLFEYLADFNRFINKSFREEALNVYGFNSACRRMQCLAVDGFNHPEGTNEDGWLAVKLRDRNFGKLHWVTDVSHIVWTTDRRLLIDGGLWKATLKRFKKNLT
ncbi:glycosyltransferase family 2 protein [Parapedobacter sp. DT-150]|uniref:glycosyltransferase family 2 protein n=1 Tax=Parapedobacter sp. DT-150 TaxID=3396162 RepID=UPI003F1B9835